MPVSCKLINGKYRIMEGNKIATTDKGNTRDGGGHNNIDACRKQASAINLNLSTNISVLSYESQTHLAVSSIEDDKQRFKKDMITEGSYVHPVHKWKLNVTAERINRWHTNFQEMRKNGVDIEVPLDHSLSAAKNLGYVIDTMVEADQKGKLTLFGILEVRGQESINIIGRNKNVSVWIDQEYSDGKGNFYGEVIKHCSVVQQPVVQQQEEFIPIAASEKGMNENVPIYHILTRSVQMTPEQLQKFRVLFGFGDDITEDNLLSNIETLNKKQTETLKAIQDENLGLKTQLDKHKVASSIDPNTMELVGTTIDDKLGMLVEKGKITPAVQKKLSAVLVGPAEHRNIFALSLGENQSPSIASQVLSALNENDIKVLGEKTGYQVLNRETPNDNDEIKPDPEAGKAMLSGAGVLEEKQEV